MLTNIPSNIKSVDKKLKSNLEEELTRGDPGRTIRNETIVPRGVIGKGMPRLRPIDMKFGAALDVLSTTTENYAYAAYAECFNWDEVTHQLDIDDGGDWFVVVFRSIRNPNANSELLYNADRLAHEEAKESGGLLKYWYGDLNEHRECLATCIWASLEFAHLAIVKPLHQKAVKLASEMYETYDLERYSILKRKGESTLHITRL